MLEDQLDWPFFEERHRVLDRGVRDSLTELPEAEQADVEPE
jgi:hypothetical protein